MDAARRSWVADWKPATQSPNDPPIVSHSATKKVNDNKKQSFGSFLASVSNLTSNNIAVPPTQGLVDELAKYLALPQEHDTDLDVLAWWRLNKTQFPILSKMARQFLAAPATSAGPERLFRLAGRMHDDMKKQQVRAQCNIHSWPL